MLSFLQGTCKFYLSPLFLQRALEGGTFCSLAWSKCSRGVWLFMGFKSFGLVFLWGWVCFSVLTKKNLFALTSIFFSSAPV